MWRRGWQIELIRRFDVGAFFEHRHQLRQIEKFRESGARSITRSFRRKLDGGRGFAEGRSPAIKVRQPLFLELVVLEIALHRVQLGHGVRHRCAGGENNAFPVCDFIHVAALGKHIGGLLRF